MPAASSVGVPAALPKTKGMLARRTSRRSKKGCGSVPRSAATLSGTTFRRSVLEASTVAHRLLGGQPFSSMVEGDLLRPAVGMRLHALYYDPHALDGLGQQFVCYAR